MPTDLFCHDYPRIGHARALGREHPPTEERRRLVQRKINPCVLRAFLNPLEVRRAKAIIRTAVDGCEVWRGSA